MIAKLRGSAPGRAAASANDVVLREANSKKLFVLGRGSKVAEAEKDDEKGEE